VACPDGEIHSWGALKLGKFYLFGFLFLAFLEKKIRGSFYVAVLF